MEKPVPLLFLVALHATFALLSLPTSAKTNILYSGHSLMPSQKLVYDNYFLVMQEDCNLVVYAVNTQHPIWASNTANSARKCYLQLLSNGELIIYGWRYGVSKVVWRSNATSKEGSYALVLKFDGSLNVYGPILWSAQTEAKGTSEATNIRESKACSTIWPATTDSVLFTGDVAPVGVTIVNGAHELRLQDSCNLTLSDTSSGTVTWASGSIDPNHLRDCFVRLEPNGELRVLYMGGEPLWGNGVTAENFRDYVLALSPEGQLEVFGPSIWESKNALVVEQVKITADTVAVN